MKTPLLAVEQVPLFQTSGDTSALLVDLDNAIAKTLDVASKMNDEVWPMCMARLRTIPVLEAKRLLFHEIPAVGGFMDDYWEVDLGNEVLMIRKPRDPIADLAEMGKSLEPQSVEEALAEIDEALDEGLPGVSEGS